MLLPSYVAPLAPFAPPAKPSHPLVLLSGKALVGVPTASQAANVDAWNYATRDAVWRRNAGYYGM